MSQQPLSSGALFFRRLYAFLGWTGLLLFAVLGLAALLGLGETHGVAVSIVLFFFLGLPGLALGLVFLMMSRWTWEERDEEDEAAAAIVRQLPLHLLHRGIVGDEGEIGQTANGFGHQQIGDGEGEERRQEIAVSVPSEAHVAEPPRRGDISDKVKRLGE